MLAFHTPRTSDTAASMKALPKRKGNPAVATYYPGQFIKPQLNPFRKGWEILFVS